MSEAKRIRKMIESVSPDDTDTLDEIDARVWCFMYQQEHGSELRKWANVPGYTRSRDALKNIRPKGWNYLLSMPETNCDHIRVYFTKYKNGKVVRSVSSWLIGKTEELAELDAIIQAIECERDNDL